MGCDGAGKRRITMQDLVAFGAEIEAVQIAHHVTVAKYQYARSHSHLLMRLTGYLPGMRYHPLHRKAYLHYTGRQANHAPADDVLYPLRKPGRPRGARSFASRNRFRFASIGESRLFTLALN